MCSLPTSSRQESLWEGENMAVKSSTKKVAGKQTEKSSIPKLQLLTGGGF